MKNDDKKGKVYNKPAYKGEAINEHFNPSPLFYKEYERDLKNVTNRVGEIIETTPIQKHDDVNNLVTKLLRYQKKLTQWAQLTAAKWIAKINKINRKEWERMSRAIGKGLERDIQDDQIGGLLKDLQAEQAMYITQLPKDAADRIQKYAMQAITRGERYETLIDKIQKEKGINYRRAKLIARTESAKAASMLTQARAQAAGVERFIWRATMDNRTRPSHAKMNGKVCSFSDPPIVDGLPLIPGQIYNCRCHAEPIFEGIK